ncbi:unnamed protein product, partial [Ilex paraguariensis]
VSIPLPPRETSKEEEREVGSSPTIDVDNLEIEVSTSEDETESIVDLQDAYNELYKECLKQGNKLFSLSTRLKMSENEKKALHVVLIESKAYICGLEEEKKSLHDK